MYGRPLNTSSPIAACHAQENIFSKIIHKNRRNDSNIHLSTLYSQLPHHSIASNFKETRRFIRNIRSSKYPMSNYTGGRGPPVQLDVGHFELQILSGIDAQDEYGP